MDSCHDDLSPLARVDPVSLAIVPLDRALHLLKHLVKEGHAGKQTRRLGEQVCIPRRLADDKATPVKGRSVLGQPGGHLGVPARWE